MRSDRDNENEDNHQSEPQFFSNNTKLTEEEEEEVNHLVQQCNAPLLYAEDVLRLRGYRCCFCISFIFRKK